MSLDHAQARSVQLQRERLPAGGALLFILAHIPLALLMREISVVAYLHAVLAVGVGVWIAAMDERPERSALVVAYVAGAEVLWRMTNDQLFWETAKYSTVLIAAIALFRITRRLPISWPIVYVVFLVPSGFLTLAELPMSEARNQLSFNMSGPIALALSSWLFASAVVTPADLQRIAVAVVGAVTGIASITLFGILTNPDITFSHQSNFALSGGFGPNQVAAAIALGMLMALVLTVEQQLSVPSRVFMLGMAIWFGAQSALTFSRGGVFCTLGAVVVAALCYARDPRRLAAIAGAALVIGFAIVPVVWSRLDQFTGGNLSMRFQDTDTSLRADLSANDLETFQEHPLLGVGPGMSKLEHLDAITSHTEFTRLLAEHGLFGLAAMGLLAWGAVRNVARGASAREQAIAAALMTWAVLFMSNSAMRLVAPAFTFGLACSHFASLSVPQRVTAPRLLTRRWVVIAAD